MAMSYGTTVPNTKNENWNTKRRRQNSHGSNMVSLVKTPYSEIRRETLDQRCKNHGLILFYKMKHNLAPQYLFSLVPESISHVSHYN